MGGHRSVHVEKNSKTPGFDGVGETWSFFPRLFTVHQVLVRASGSLV